MAANIYINTGGYVFSRKRQHCDALFQIPGEKGDDGINEEMVELIQQAMKKAQMGQPKQQGTFCMQINLCKLHNFTQVVLKFSMTLLTNFDNMTVQ